jgi:hypothetical protein
MVHPPIFPTRDLSLPRSQAHVQMARTCSREEGNNAPLYQLFNLFIFATTQPASTSTNHKQYTRSAGAKLFFAMNESNRTI